MKCAETEYRAGILEQEPKQFITEKLTLSGSSVGKVFFWSTCRTVMQERKDCAKNKRLIMHSSALTRDGNKLPC
jgi:hypothetical protein